MADESAHRESIEWRGDRATIEAFDADDDRLRRYELTTTHRLRDGVPNGNRLVVEEQADKMTTRTGSLFFDGLFALALSEAKTNSVRFISDPNFGRVACDCFETGLKWNYVWTRDTAYAVDLGLGFVDPSRARRSLEFKTSALRLGDSERWEVVQDTGSGGSWPVSTDRVSWAFAADELLKFLTGDERTAFRDHAFRVLKATLATDRGAVFDTASGLYRGEFSFLDWREQTYPSWTKANTVHIGMSETLSTNIAHYKALELTARLAREQNLPGEAEVYEKQAGELKSAIQQRFWLPNEGLFSSLITTRLDPAPTQKFDLLGSALAILTGIATEEQAAKVVANYPMTEAGAPVIWPQLHGVPIYHNRGIWPFVTAYALRAAKQTGNAAAFDIHVASLMRGAALNLSNMENFEYLTQNNWFDDRELSGPVINSQRQLWSVAGYLAFVVRGVFGFEATTAGLRIEPFVSANMRRELFGKSDEARLEGLSYRGRRLDIILKLPKVRDDMHGALSVAAIRLNGVEREPGAEWSEDELEAHNVATIELAYGSGEPGRVTVIAVSDQAAPTPQERRRLEAPPEPHQVRVFADGAKIKVEFRGMDDANVRFNIYRNGQKVASRVKLPVWTDEAPSPNETGCYAVEAEWLDTGLKSHHTNPQCYWPAGTVETIPILDGRVSHDPPREPMRSEHQWFIAGWGRPEEKITLRDLKAPWSGAYEFQVIYANRGPISTGVTACVKQLRVVDQATGAVVGEGVLSMPHLGLGDNWNDSSFVSARLEAGRHYRLELSDYLNMSYFSHFATYTQRGGQRGPDNRCDLAGFKMLSMTRE